MNFRNFRRLLKDRQRPRNADDFRCRCFQCVSNPAPLNGAKTVGWKQHVKLTKRSIDAISAPERVLIIRDDDLSGFSLRVMPSGKKIFLAQYRVGGGRGGRQRKVKLGVYGTTTVDQARTKAREILARAHLGDDFAAQRDKIRKSQTVNQLIDAWSRDGVLTNRRTGASRKPVNINQEIALANHHIRPLIGSRPLDDLRKGDIQRLKTQIATGESRAKKKGRKRGLISVSGGEGTAVRTIRLFSSILSYAVDAGMIEANPALGIKLAPGGQRHRYLSQDELRRLGEVLARPVDSPTTSTAVTVIRLLILTGARRGEIEGLKWSEVDFQFAMLRKETSKTGAKVIPLARSALQILDEQRQWTSGNQPWVFPALRGEGHFDGLGKEWSRIRKLAKLDDVRVHDLRHTFASVGAGGGIGLPLIGGILGHRQASTTQRYAHLADTPLRAAANFIGAEIAASLAMLPRESQR
jgi:integrase